MSKNAESQEYRQLRETVRELQEFARPLMEDIINTPIWPIVSRVMALDVDCEQDIRYIRREVEECRQALEEMSVSYIRQITSKPRQSEVFKTVNSATRFEKTLKRFIGRKVKLDDGTETEITPEMVKILTKYKFSIGTPPITPAGIRTIEEIVFGGELRDLYQFRDLLGGDVAVFDRFMRTVSRMIEQSTHYTTVDEEKEFKKKASDFSNLEGLRGLCKTPISGSPDMAVRLIRENLFGNYDTANTPLVEVEIDDIKDPQEMAALRARMTEENRKIFILKVKSVPHNVFTDQEIKEEWRGLLGRVIIVENSEKASRESVTMVHSIHSTDIIENLRKFHIKSAGTLANTQLNLRLILESFQGRDLTQLRRNIERKMSEYEEEGTLRHPVAHARRREWLVNSQHDYLELKRFHKFLTFLDQIKNLPAEEFKELQDRMTDEHEEWVMKYFFSSLRDKGYECVSIPQGGGRRCLEIIGNYILEGHRCDVAAFRDQTDPETGLTALEKCEMELSRRHDLANIYTSEPEDNASQRAYNSTSSPLQALRMAEEGRDTDDGQFDHLGDAYRRWRYDRSVRKATRAQANEADRLDHFSDPDLPSRLRDQIRDALRKHDLGNVTKVFERGTPQELASWWRGLRATAGENLFYRRFDKAASAQRAARHQLEVESLELPTNLINSLRTGSGFTTRLVIPASSWSYNDVFREKDFPSKNTITIGMDENGLPDYDSFEQKLEDVRHSLAGFPPELFHLYCSSMILVVNSPSNPTGRVYPDGLKLRILKLASKYGIKVIEDDAYHDLVTGEIKDRQGDLALIEFYEKHRSRFKNPVEIFTAFPATKYFSAAGERIGSIITNETSGNFCEFAGSQIDGVNMMSLYLENEKGRTGLLVKEVCKVLEEALWREVDFVGDVVLGQDNPLAKGVKKLREKRRPSLNFEQVIDGILEQYFSDLRAENFVAPIYLKLLEARNTLGLLRIREADHDTQKKFINQLISDLKGYRLEKMAAKEAEKRLKIAQAVVEKVSAEYPELKKSVITPEGAFYLDTIDHDPAKNEFMALLARTHKADAVALNHGNIRFSFGGLIDDTEEAHQEQGRAFETYLRIILKYWNEFCTLRQKYEEENRKNKNKPELLVDPVRQSLEDIFPGGDLNPDTVVRDTRLLWEKASTKAIKPSTLRPYTIDEEALPYVHQIEGEYASMVINIDGIDCQTPDQMLRSRPFKAIYNYLLLEIRNSIPALSGLDNDELISLYGAHALAGRFDDRTFKDNEREIFAQILKRVAAVWFADSTTKILSEPAQDDPHLEGKALMGSEARLRGYITSVLKVFMPREEVGEIDIKHTFQVGYGRVDLVTPDANLPVWSQMMIGKGSFVSTAAPTDPNPKMKTGSTTRVAGHDYGIYRRDGDGIDAPDRSFFGNRLAKFAEVMDPAKFIFKIIQVGPVRTLLIIDKSYGQYVAEELRLFPQYDLTAEQLQNVKPDTISFLGLPGKVMGKDYKVGYFMDKNADNSSLPVSWVSKDKLTDYMGYLKKPILTLHNEKVKEMGGVPIHGAAFTIVFKNGLRKTVVMTGDSGTGKSETVIAMREKIVKQLGQAAEVADVEMLAGDMLSLWKGADGEVYMLGTESGDFLRMSDISQEWQDRYSDKIDSASVTNADHPTNPRTTIGGLCDPEKFLRPVRINMVFNIDNFNDTDSALQEITSGQNFFGNTVPRGQRQEKGTSGDQPNIFATIDNDRGLSGRRELMQRYGEEIDDLLDWEVLLAPSGKAENGILRFKDRPGKVTIAKNMVNDIFKGRATEIKKKIDGQEIYQSFQIVDTSYDAVENRFKVILEGEDGGRTTANLDRNVFNGIFAKPTASTYYGNPFMEPNAGLLFKRLGEVADANPHLILGNLYTRLSVPGYSIEGPSIAADALINFMLSDPRINERFQQNKEKVYKALVEKYGQDILGQGDLPEAIQAHNLRQLERQSSNAIQLNRFDNNSAARVSTTRYQYDPEISEQTFRPTLITPQIKQCIQEILREKSHNDISFDNLEFDAGIYRRIQQYDNEEELIYQILILNGIINLGTPEADLYKAPREVKKAARIARELVSR